MSYQITLNFEDGVTRFIECQDGELVADASLRARINIPLDCRDGVCGTCKALCESGEYELGDYVIDEAMTKEEAGGDTSDLPDDSADGLCRADPNHIRRCQGGSVGP